ncbi:MAG TPA: flagellar basal body-associated FliL family protein, partial [Desulfobacteraceae bacterium]|nr:flagellar basal body-associated FliL family protein [Desulfobacteraceae bacterium]
AGSDEDELGELSQDDIDSLLNGSSMGGEASPDDDDDFDLVSQDDIDRLMQGTGPDSSTPEKKESGGGEEGGGDAVSAGEEELVSQDDIDSLLADAGTGDSAPGGLAGEEEEVEAAGEEELVSQDDIDSLLADAGTGNSPPGDIVEEDDSNDEPAFPDDGGSQGTARETGGDNDDVIDEAQAVDIQACLVTQETVDQLMAQDDAALEGESEEDFLEEPEPEQDPGAAMEEDLDPLEEITEDVSQNEIDALLEDSAEEVVDDSDDESSLISQGDIDSLLGGSEEEDEDLLGDVDDEGELEEEDALNWEEDAEDQDHQVVLEEAQEEAGSKNGETTKKKQSGARKMVLLAVVMLVVSLSGLAGYFFLFAGSGGKAESDRPDSPAMAGQNIGSGVDTVEIDLQPPVVTSEPGTIELNGFVVLSDSPGDSLAYLAVDLSVDYSNGRALDEMEKQMSLYRDIVYDALKKAVRSDKNKAVSEKELLAAVKNALNRVMPGKYIDDVRFTAFKTG